MQLPTSPPIDPALNGFTFILTDSSGTVLFSRFVPPGLAPSSSAPGWKVTATTFQFKDKNGTLAGGVNKVQVKPSLHVSGLLSIKILAKAGAFQTSHTVPTFRLILIPGDGTTAANGQCATRAFNPASGPAPLCQFKTAFDRLQCK